MITPTIAGKRIKLMATCLCDGFYADVAKATYKVLEHLGCEIEFPVGQTCCGQPAHNAGDWKSARKVIEHTLDVFRGQEPILVPSGSCAAMMRHGTLLCMRGQENEVHAQEAARRTWELCEFIVEGLGRRAWPGKFEGRVSLHRSCHTRGSKAYESAVTLLSSIEGLELCQVGELDQCCGFGGAFAVSFPNVSKEMGQLKIEHLTESNPDCVASLDMACMMHFGGMMQRQELKIPRYHVAEILLKALDSTGEGS